MKSRWKAYRPFITFIHFVPIYFIISFKIIIKNIHRQLHKRYSSILSGRIGTQELRYCLHSYMFSISY